MKNKVVCEGIVTQDLKGLAFSVCIKNNDIETTVTGYLAGKLRKNHIRVLVGDKVRIELSPYDLARGRITYRYKRV